MGLKADEKLCPKCAEPIKKAALVCRHCGHIFTAEDLATQQAADASAAKAGGIGCLVIIGVIILVGMCSSMGGNNSSESDSETNATAVEDRRKGFHCLSSWDGSHRELADAVKASLRDPRSFEHSETRITPVDADGNHTLMMEYRARNGFGGMNVGQVAATVKNSDCSFQIIVNTN